MSQTAFALRADHEDFVGGQLAWGPSQQTFDVGEELSNHGGVIVVEIDPDNPQQTQQQLIDALDAYPALRRVSIKEADQRLADHAASQPLPEGWRDLHKDELATLAEKRKISTSGTKDDIVKRLAASEPAEEPAQHAGEELTEEILTSLPDDDLKKIAQERGLQVKASDKSGDLVSLILENQKEGGA